MLLDIEQLSDYIKLSKSTIYKGTMSYRIPHIKAGKKLLFNKEVIDTWLEAQSVPTKEEVGNSISKLLKTKQ